MAIKEILSRAFFDQQLTSLESALKMAKTPADIANVTLEIKKIRGRRELLLKMNESNNL